MNEVDTLNDKHSKLITDHLRFLQGRVYKVTEHDNTTKKFSQFQGILNNIIDYSNDFKSNSNEGEGLEEWVYMIPNLTLYASIGFLIGTRTDNLEQHIDFEQELTVCMSSTMNTVGELSDMLTDLSVMKEVNKIMGKC